MSRKKLYNIIKNEQEYWLVDQIKREITANKDYMEDFNQILSEWKTERAGYISVLMDPMLEENMFNLGFHKISTIVEYTRRLDDEIMDEPDLETHCLADGTISDQKFAQIYEKCRSGSANKNKQQTLDQVMRSLKQELGANWRSHCYIFKIKHAVIGLAIPHIEMGTEDEGRLFYFGVLPAFRGQGFGKMMHLKTLALLKGMKANYYVGSTDEANLAMIQIFKQNGCQVRDQKGIYRMESV
ncbi:GNAT family N-acetyltransferase [Virgibacillus sp. YIM 98842]|uniref:GNAT family N-acetyltransferase n=1 Tax=Virgibacillus sp. YIM 98842 TaxID=2663533 RepID=UPI0013DD831A|nr:GNAT family N-acetyltransferase [Virgibacillus sp. YIM 98842]